MTLPIFRPATDDDIASVAARMRESDVLEVAAASGRSPLVALRESVRDSDAAFAAVFGDRAEAIFGFQYHGGVGADIWMLGTPELRKHARVMVTEGRRILDAWCEHFPVLHNFVDDSNTDAKRWLRAVGCLMASKPTTYGEAGTPFRYFWRAAHV